MNYFLMMLVIAMSIGGFYGYKYFDTEVTAQQQQIQQLDDAAKAAAVSDADKKKYEDDEAKLTKQLNEAQSMVSDLTSQLQAAQAKATTTVPTPSTNALATITPPPGKYAWPCTHFGTISTMDGKTYVSCKLLKVEIDGIVVNHQDGITKIEYAVLPADLQKVFGYDLKVNTELTTDQVQALEDQRLSADAAGK